MRLCAAALVLLVSAASSVKAEPVPPPGASSCTGCHASSKRPSSIAPIAGMPAAEAANALREFRNGSRPATVMDRIARGFTEAELDAIAEHFAATAP